MAERPSSPGPRKTQLKRGQHGLHNHVSGGRDRGQHGTPFKPNNTGLNQNSDQSRRGGHAKTTRGANTRGQGRGRATMEATSTKRPLSSTTRPSSITQPVLKSKLSMDEIRQADSARENLSARRDEVHSRYIEFRKNAIENRLMDDPNRRKTLQDSIRKIGTCQQMCDEKERVDRMFENLVDLAETEPHPESHKPVPIEGKMVKRFRRAAAGDPDQQLEELRTPSTLRKTMDYLIQDVISSDSRLPQVHKFVWDRTRAIRNDFTIQNLFNPEDVRHEIDCYERIARFHIISMHQMVNPDYIRPDEHYDGQQDLEQLNKTILTLLTKYDDFRHVLDFPNEAEFRAYFILIEMRNAASDLEDRIQRWPRHFLNDGRVKTALKLYTAACSIDQRYGTLGTPIPVAMAQANSGRFWTLLDSLQVSYLMACTVEMSFFNVRFTALNSLWIATKNASKSNQSSLRFWTKAALAHYLGFDDQEQAADFCSDLGLSLATRTDDHTGEQEQYLDFTSNDVPSLDKTLLSMSQVFSEGIVEKKRHYRTLFAVISGMSIAEAKRAGQIDASLIHVEETADAEEHSMFVGEDDDKGQPGGDFERDDNSGYSLLNPAATEFSPQFQTTGSNPLSVQTEQPRWMTHFGQKRSPDSALSGGLSKAIFTPVNDSNSRPVASSPFATVESTSSLQNGGSSSPNSAFFQPSTTPVMNAQPIDPNKTSPVVASTGFNFGEGIVSKSLQNKTLNPLFQATSNPEPETQINSTRANPFVNFGTSPAKPAQNLQQTKFSGVTTLELSAPDLQVTSSLPDTVQSSLSSNSAASQSFTTFKFNTFPASEKSDSTIKPSTTTQQFSFDTNPQSVESASALTQSTLPPFQPLKVPAAAPADSLPLPAKRPSLEFIQFPPVSSQRLNSEDQNQYRTSHSTISSTDIPRQASLSPSSQPQSHPRLHSPSIESVSLLPSQPSSHKEKEIDQEQLLHDLVRLGLVQTDGIVDMFVSRKICNIVRDVFDGFQQRRLDKKLTAIRHQVLKRKFFFLWKEIAESRRSYKQVMKRRSRLAASIKADAEKEKRRRLELEAIVEADRISRRIKKEQRRMMSIEVQKQDQEEENTPEVAASTDATIDRQPETPKAPVAGQKRKSPANGVLNGSSNDPSNYREHKRSRTLGTSSDTSLAPVETVITHLQNINAGSRLRRSISQKSLGSTRGVKDGSVDKTRTDYFRLIAYGLDPKTPLTPLTSTQVEEQKRQKAEKDVAILARITKGRKGPFARETSEKSVNADTAVHPSSSEAPHTSAEKVLGGSLREVSGNDPETDPIILACREMQRELAADTELFRDARIVIEKQIEREEDLRRSLTQSQSSNSSFGVSVNGFARSLNGYDYVPPNLTAGQTLSRTEERIRQTGAHGLAYKPIGGTPKSTYTPVAMSRKSALRYTSGIGEESNRPRKRSIDEVYGSNAVDNRPRTTHVSKATTASEPQQVSKKPRINEPATSSSFGHSSPKDDGEEQENSEVLEGHEEQDLDARYMARNGSIYDDELAEDEEYSGDEQGHGDDEAEEEEDEDEDQEDKSLNQGTRRIYHPMFYTDDDDDEADEDEADEADEQAEQYQQGEQNGSDGDEDSAYLASYGYGLQAPVPFSRHGSQALSGVATPDTGAGASADDAIELSD